MDTDNGIYVNVFDENTKETVVMELEEIVKKATTIVYTSIQKETPDVFEIEAIKAISIVIRTQVIRRLKRFNGIKWNEEIDADISTGMSGFEYIIGSPKIPREGFDEVYNKCSALVDDTKGFIITFGGKPIKAEYHLVCGGGTENSEDVLGNKIMYLRKVLCEYCFNSTNYEGVIDIPINEIEDKLNVKVTEESSIYGPEIKGVFEDVQRDETGRVKRIKVGERYFSGIEIRDLLGLNSSRFGWDPLVIRFKSRGLGDGLDMCLYGAYKMAEEGKSYTEILKYYYTGVQIVNINSAGGGVPLSGKTFIIDPGHGGDNGGDEKGPTGLREKDVNLYIAKSLVELLEKDGALVYLTRLKDEDISIIKRIEYVNSIRPNFLISIHQNFFFALGVSGTEVYYYRGDLEGEKMGRLILDNIAKSLGTANRGTKNAEFAIIRESKVSSILVECMYISNPKEEEALKSDQVKREIAKAIYRGVLEYYGI